MTLHLDKNSYLVFDLDDTLYQEIDFLKSAYQHISGLLAAYLQKEIYDEMWGCYVRKENTFEWLVKEYGTQIPELNLPFLLNEYRCHRPSIQLQHGTKRFIEKLNNLNIPCGLITDGRSITQRNKLGALGLQEYFKDIIISEEFGSEKPNEKNYLYFENKYKDKKFYYIGDNTAKDFIVPAKLGWFTICLKDNGRNIHAQDLKALPVPNLILSSFGDIHEILTCENLKN